MLARGFLWVTNHWPAARRLLFRAFFQALGGIYRGADDWTFMNYGYVPLDGDPRCIELQAGDETERTCAQLYHRVAAGMDLAGTDVLEVSSGRGGGASYIHRYLDPRSTTGLDISGQQVAFCRRVHRAPGLEFEQGDAESLPFADASFDAVVNVEASFCYGDIDRFFAEVRRVLRPGGHFLYADLRLAHEVEGFMAALERSGLDGLEAEDITGNVVAALKIDGARRARWTDERSPAILRSIMRTFGGAEGSRIPTLLSNGGMKYFRFVLQKSGRGPVASAQGSRDAPRKRQLAGKV